MLQPRRVDGELRVRIPDDEVGVEPGGDAPFAIAEAGEARRRRRSSSARQQLDASAFSANRALADSRFASVQTADSESWSDAMPPHARMKSPGHFSAGGAGE